MVGTSVTLDGETSVAPSNDEVDALAVDFPLRHYVVAAFLDA